MAKCIELKYTLINEKGGASDSTSLVIKVPEELLNNDSITSTDLLDEMISALNSTNHPWHDIAKILVNNNKLSSKLLDVDSFIEFESEENVELTPTESWINKYPQGSIKVFEPHLLIAASVFNSKSGEDVLIRELLKSTQANLAITATPFDMTGLPVKNDLNTPIGLYKDDIKMISLYVPNSENKFLDTIFIGVKGKKLKEVFTHELIHANFYNMVKEGESEILEGGLKNTLAKLLEGDKVYNKNILNIVKNIKKSNEGLQEFTAYYLSNIDFRNTINEINPDFKNTFFQAIFSNTAVKNYPLIANIISTATLVPQIDIEVKPSNYDTITNEDFDKDDKSEEDVEIKDADEGLPMQEIEGEPYLKPDFIKVKDKEHRKDVAKHVAEVFQEATDVNNDYIKFKRNYTEEVKISNRNKALLHDLKQHDLIRVPVRKQVSGKWVDSDKYTYRPIIDTALWDGELIFAVASPKGEVVYYKEGQVNSIKRNKGVLRDSGLKTTDKKFKKALLESFKTKLIDPKYTSVKNGIKFWNTNEAVYVSFAENAKSNTRINKNTREKIEDENSQFTEENSSFLNERRKDDVYDENNFNSLRPGDVVKSSFVNKEGKAITFQAPIVSIQGDLIEVLKVNDDKLDTYFLNTYAISGVYMLNENHEDDWQLLDSTMNSQLKDGFSKTLGLNKVNFKNVDKNGLPFKTKNYNDLSNFNLTPSFYKGYSEWRTGLTDSEYDDMTLADLLQNNRTVEAEYYKYSLAVERRRNVTDNIGPGSYVQLEQLKMKKEQDSWIIDEVAKNKNDYKTLPARVIAKNGDWLKVRIMEPVWTNDKITGYKFANKSVNILQNSPTERPSEKYAIRAVYYNNIEQLTLVNYLNNIKSLFKTNFADSKQYFKEYKENNKEFPTDDKYQRFNFLNKLSLHNKYVEDNSSKLSDGYYNKDVVTSLSDLYELRFFEENVTYDQKLKALSRTKKGSIILMKIKEKFDKDGNLVPNKTTAEYTTAIVTGKDKTTGRPMISYTYKGDGLPKTISRPVRLNEIIGVGYANFTDTNVGIEVDDYIKTIRDQQIKLYLEGKSIKTYASKKEAMETESYKNLKNHGVQIAQMYVNPETGAKTTDKNKYKNPTIEYYLAFENSNKGNGAEAGFFLSPAESSYLTIGRKQIAAANTKAIISNLRPGDVLTEEFQKGGKKQYKETVISKIEDGIIYGFSMYIKKGSKRSDGVYVPYGSAILGKQAGKLTGFGNVIKIELGYYGNDLSSKERRNNIMEGVLLNREKATIKAPSKIQKQTANAAKVKTTNSKIKTAESHISSNILSNPLFLPDDAPFSKSIAEVKSKEKVTRKELENLSDNLANMYNATVLVRSSEDIKIEFGNTNNNLDISKQRAFIKDGVIYINSDYATLAEPIHELSHLIIEGLKITDPTTYQNIMDKVITHPHYQTISNYYPELSEEKLNEEVFVTILGERYNYNAKIGGVDSKSEKWQNENTNFFTNIVNRIKRFFAKLFGIDSNRIFNSDDVDFMNSSINDILDKFNNNITQGNYKKEVDLSLQKYTFIQTNTYLKNADGDTSSLYHNLIDNGFTDNFASNSWVYTKSSNFAEWHNDQILVDQDGEPKIFYRTKFNNFVEQDVDDLGDAVFIKGSPSLNSDGSLSTDEDNIKSVYSSTIEYKPDSFAKESIEDFSSNIGLPMIGDAQTLRNSLKTLKSQFGRQEFELRSLNDDGIFYIKYYDKPSDAVIKLKELLMSKNLINATC